MIAVTGVGCSGAACVTAGIRFGEEEAADFLAAVERRQPLFFLLFGAEGIDRTAAERGVCRNKDPA